MLPVGVDRVVVVVAGMGLVVVLVPVPVAVLGPVPRGSLGRG
jgi:hypothetical protein